MPHAFTRRIEDLLRSTLLKLEQSLDVRQDDPALVELKRHILRTIADLEREKSARSSSADFSSGPRRLRGAA